MKAEKERKKQQNSERKIKFYDANESKKRKKMLSERHTKAIEKFMIRNSRKGPLYAPNVLDGNMC